MEDQLERIMETGAKGLFVAVSVCFLSCFLSLETTAQEGSGTQQDSTG